MARVLYLYYMRSLLLVVLVLLVANSCKKECSNKAADRFEACSKSEVCIDDIEEVGLGCYYVSNSEVIINNTSQYQAIFDSCCEFDVDTARCATYIPPSIDFSTKTLLGMWTSGGGCGEPSYNHKIVQNDQNKEYTWTIRMKQYSGCLVGYGKMIWVTIPKINSPVNFEVVELTCKK